MICHNVTNREISVKVTCATLGKAGAKEKYIDDIGQFFKYY